jgi:hypothetical protein
MNLNKILVAYTVVQTELHKKLEYHLNQNAPFSSLIVKIGKLCAAIKSEHDQTDSLNTTHYGFEDNYLKNHAKTEWLSNFDAVIFNNQYTYRPSEMREASVSNWTHSLWVVHQMRLIRQAALTHDDANCIKLCWLLAESVRRQAYQYIYFLAPTTPVVANNEFSLKLCYSFYETISKESQY